MRFSNVGGRLGDFVGSDNWCRGSAEALYVPVSTHTAVNNRENVLCTYAGISGLLGITITELCHAVSYIDFPADSAHNIRTRSMPNIYVDQPS